MTGAPARWPNVPPGVHESLARLAHESSNMECICQEFRSPKVPMTHRLATTYGMRGDDADSSGVAVGEASGNRRFYPTAVGQVVMGEINEHRDLWAERVGRLAE
jgi:hypothetical protein